VHNDHLRTLEELASRFLGRKVRVKVTARAANPTAAPTPATEKPSRSQQEAKVMAHPAVRAAVEILGGELQDVKARPRADRGDG